MGGNSFIWPEANRITGASITRKRYATHRQSLSSSALARCTNKSLAIACVCAQPCEACRKARHAPSRQKYPLCSPHPGRTRTRVDNLWGEQTRRWNGLGNFSLRPTFEHLDANLKVCSSHRITSRPVLMRHVPCVSYDPCPMRAGCAAASGAGRADFAGEPAAVRGYD